MWFRRAIEYHLTSSARTKETVSDRIWNASFHFKSERITFMYFSNTEEIKGFYKQPHNVQGKWYSNRDPWQSLSKHSLMEHGFCFHGFRFALLFCWYCSNTRVCIKSIQFYFYLCMHYVLYIWKQNFFFKVIDPLTDGSTYLFPLRLLRREFFYIR